MTDWAEIGKSIVPGESVVAESERILRGLSARCEPQLQARVAELLGSRFLGPDTVRAMLRTQDIGVVAPLPQNIVEVLNMQSPVHEQGVLVRERHILGYVPDNVSLKDLSEARGEQIGRKLDIILANNLIVGLTLSEVNQSGHWVLISDKFPLGTESKCVGASAAELKKTYGQCYSQPDVISFTTALLLNEFKNGERWYSDIAAWCRDPRIGTPLQDRSCFGEGRPSALRVGGVGRNGFIIVESDTGSASSEWGCAASWNFGA